MGSTENDLKDLDLDRITSKGIFLRTAKRFMKGFEEITESVWVEDKFAELGKCWKELVGKHERYIALLSTFDIGRVNAENGWLEESENMFEEIEGKYYRRRGENGKHLKEGMERGNIEGICGSQFENFDGNTEIERYRRLNQFEAIIFRNHADCVRKLLQIESVKEDPSVRAVEEAIADLRAQFSKCKEVNARVTLIDDGTVEEDMVLMKEIIDTFVTVKQLADRILEKFDTSYLGNQRRSTCGDSLKLERMKLPYFNGYVRDYIRFKSDFVKYVMPEITSKSKAAYVLKSCLCPITRSKVANIDDDLDAMWNRLDEIYGRVSKLVDVVMFGIKSVKPLKDGDNKGFLELVDIVEKGYQDLKRMNVEKEMSNATTVSFIEERLPRLIRREWSLKVSQERAEDTNHFSALMEFLLEQRRAIEYEIMDIRNTPNDSNVVEGSVSSINGNENDKEIKYHRKTDGYKCWIHKNDDHELESCTQYKNKSPTDKIRFLSGHGFCWNCLGKGHRSYECSKRSKCGINGCNWNHHPSLHEAHISGVKFSSMPLSLWRSNIEE